MNWDKEAEERLKRVPFFIRKRVKREVEKEAAARGDRVVMPIHLEICRKRYISSTRDQTRGYEVELCFGADGCPNAISDIRPLAEELKEILEGSGLTSYLKEMVQGPLKMHHAFRVSISNCPNSCSRPQIVDFGLIATATIRVNRDEGLCTLCNLCVEVCREDALTMDKNLLSPMIYGNRCLGCAQCARVCNTGTISVENTGFRVLIGGKLGRHPQLGFELPGIYDHSEVKRVLQTCIDHFMANKGGKYRLGTIINKTGVDFLRLQETTNNYGGKQGKMFE